MSPQLTRRQTLATLVATTALPALPTYAQSAPQMRLGLVTYLWGKDWDLPALIANCEEAGLYGLETRTEHAHGVEPSLTKDQRAEVKQRFADSPVELVGYGSNAQYHDNDPAKLKANIELTKEYLQLMHDCGGSGVKVKPNGFVNGVPREKTIEQIGKALNEVAAFGADLGQQIRVEAHGKGTQELVNMKAIFDVADHPNATVCWNSNAQDLHGEGLEANFNMVKHRFGDTVHIRELHVGAYPYQQLMNLFVANNYAGWILLECRTNPHNRVDAMIQQRHLFNAMVSRAGATLA
ncbi:MAG: sugar phosphate isomerase/epimerase family protein [Planctomycetota bacterium]|jgi:sugar phosphate isomerase/epimerase